ncbi:MAG TPA: periplasmic heavy metal sensor [Thermoanaerobaculia bacterium]|nr:periplasmic heavy metal sensor [Thermoanaerobaculia bacterium]
MTRRIGFALIAFFVGATAFAQLPPGKWWRRPEIVQSLNLSDEQQDRLESIFRASAIDLIDLKADVDKAAIALRGELDRPQLDRAAIHRIGVRLSEGRGRLFDRELMMLIEMRSVLTEPQWNRMRNELDRIERPNQQRPVQRPRP